MNYFTLKHSTTRVLMTGVVSILLSGFALGDAAADEGTETIAEMNMAAQELPALSTLDGPSKTMRIIHGIVMYLPDRVIDLLDTVTIEIDSGPRFGANLIMTRACQLGVIGGLYYGMGWDWQRRIGSFAETDFSARLFFYGYDNVFRRGTTGTMLPIFALEDGTPDPNNEIYTSEVRDYYAIGAEASCLVGVKVLFHPTGFWDFLCGFILLDPDDDDLKLRYAFPAATQ